MMATVSNFDGSLGVLFPKHLIQNFHFFENENVNLFVKDDSIIITRLESKKHLTTKERISFFCETTEDIQLSEIDWGKPQGKEIW